MKVSEITVDYIAEYIRVDTNVIDLRELEVMLNAAKAFIRNYTGLTDTEIDEHEDISIAVYVLCEDMYDNRSYYVDKSNLNKVVETILGMHCINLL